MSNSKNTERAIVGIDGNAGFCLLGEDIMSGECEFVTVEVIGDELLSKAQIRAANKARFNLEQRLGHSIQVYYDKSHPYGG